MSPNIDNFYINQFVYAMKTKALFILFLIVSLSLSAQIKKGTFMLEGGINLLGDWNSDESVPFTEGFGISFGINDQYNKHSITGVEEFRGSAKRMNYSLAPRLGYYFFRNFVVGLDFRYRLNINHWSRFTDRYRSSQYGFFARKYFGNRRITPFIESGIGIGGSKSILDSTSPGGAFYQQIESNDLFYFSGAIGACYSINPKFKINLLGKVQHTREEDIALYGEQFGDSKMLGFDSGLILSFSYFLNRKLKSSLIDHTFTFPE